MKNIYLVIILISVSIVLAVSSPIIVESSSDNIPGASPPISVEEAQSENNEETPQVEVYVKDNKTHQTSTIFFPSNERLFRELQDMKIALQQLQQTVDYLVNHVIADLEEENQRLKELLRIHNIEPTAGLKTEGTRFIPGSRDTTVKYDTVTSIEKSEVEKTIPEKRLNNISSPQSFYFKIVEEWGRDPEIVKQLKTSAPTVKGIVAVVPPNTPREKLEELAKELRSKYDEYDNINIEVFDDEESARAFADKHQRDPNHNVLSISRHKESGRDVITIYGVPINSSFSPTENSNSSFEQ